MNATGAIVASNDSLPFRCSINTWVTDRNATSGKRWAVEPGVGAFAFDAQLNITSSILAKVTWLAVGPDGDAVMFDGTSGVEELQRVSHAGSTVKWAFQPMGRLIGNPVVNSALRVVLPEFVESFGQYQGTVSVEKIDYSTGLAPVRTDLENLTYEMTDPQPSPPVTFNLDGSILYLPVQTQPGATMVLACPTNTNGCTPKWQSPSLTPRPESSSATRSSDRRSWRAWTTGERSGCAWDPTW